MKLNDLYFSTMVAFLAISCNNLYYDIPDKLKVTEREPVVDYVFPVDDDVDINTNSAVLISFDRPMNISSLNPDTIKITDSSGNAVPGKLQPYGDRIMVFSSLDGINESANLIFAENTEYTVIVSGAVEDAMGYRLGKDYQWNFNTGSEEDSESPEIIKNSPGDGYICSPGEVSLSVTFNEHINPLTINSESFSVTRRNGLPVPGTVNYDGKTRSLFFIPDSPYNSNALYNVYVSEIKDLSGNLMKYPVHFSFSTGAVHVAGDDAENFSNGAGTFGQSRYGDDGIMGQILRTRGGSLLMDVNGVAYGQSLAPVFDIGTDSSIASGKHLRLVVDGENIMDPEGLGLVPYAMRMADEFISPPRDKCYIDPIAGRFVLPRPVFWSRMESWNNFYNPEIKCGEPSTSRTGTFQSESFRAGKFGNSLELNSYVHSVGVNGKAMDGSMCIDPCNGMDESFQRGTMSMWIKIDTDAYCHPKALHFSNNATCFILGDDSSNLRFVLSSEIGSHVTVSYTHLRAHET